MNGEIITGIRVRLQRRWRRVRSAERGHIAFPLRAFREFILTDTLCAAMVEALEAQHHPDAEHLQQAIAGEGEFVSGSEEEAASFGWALLKHLADLEEPRKIESCMLDMSHAAGETENSSFIQENYLEPLFDYLDEHLDSHAELLAALVRFQQWARWFGHAELAAVVEAEAEAVEHGGRKTQQSEDRLQGYLYEWLFRDGMNFTEMDREPQTGVGRPDFKFTLHGQVIASEVKLFGAFGPSTYTKADLRKGVNQLLGYMDDFNAAVGYLVIFNRDARGLRCRIDGHHDGVPRLRVAGSRTIYVLVVPAITPDSASRGSGTQPVELTAEDLLSSSL